MQLENWLALTLEPSPPGEGTHFGHAGTNHGMVRLGEAIESFALSPGERVGVRASVHPTESFRLLGPGESRP